MRLAILDSGHTFGTKAFFAVIRAFSRQPVPDAAKLVTYRPRVLRRADEGGHARGDARTLRMVGRGPRADGRVRIEDE